MQQHTRAAGSAAQPDATSASGGRTSPARFVLLTDLSATIARAATVREPRRVTWNLLSANNRSLGRAATVFASATDCVEATGMLVERISDVAAVVARRDRAPGGLYWAWTVSLEGAAVAESAFRYHRRIECERSLRRFLASTPTASPPGPTPLRVGERLGGDRG